MEEDPIYLTELTDDQLDVIDYVKECLPWDAIVHGFKWDAPMHVEFSYPNSELVHMRTVNMTVFK